VRAYVIKNVTEKKYAKTLFILFIDFIYTF